MGIAEKAAGHVAAVGWHAVRLYRLSRWLHLHGRHASALLVSTVNRVATGVEIPPSANFGDGLVIMHGHGIVIHSDLQAGRGCIIYQQVTLGGSSHSERPTLGDDVTVYSGAKVLGSIHVGDGAVIGANAVVLHDVPAGALAVGVPARIVSRGSARATLDH